MRLPTIALLCLLLLTPPASAAFWSRSVEIDVPPHAIGATLRYEHVFAEDGIASHGAYLAKAVNAGRARDAFGIERAVVSYQLQTEQEGAATWGARCDVLRGGQDVVRMETLFGAFANSFEQGWNASVAGLTLDGEHTIAETTYTTRFGGHCMTAFLPPGRYAEGQTLWLDALLPGAPRLSAPAQPTSFEGRDALAARFVHEEGWSFTATLADGLPALAAMHYDGLDEEEVTRLVAFLAGEGEAVPAPAGVALPPRHPGATFLPAAPTTLDLSALALAYPLDEAIANLRADPRMGLDAWLRAHPDALLVGAYYDRDARNTPTDAAVFETDGGWAIVFGEGDLWRSWYTSRSALGHGAGALLPTAARDVQNFAFEEQRLEDASYSFDVGPYEAADVPSLLAALPGEGIDPRAVRAVEFSRFQVDEPRAFLRLSEVSYAGGDGDGGFVQFDMASGALSALGHTRVRTDDTGLLALAPDDDTATAARAGDDLLLGGVPVGLGVAAAAATSLGLLALLVKLFFPLYSRLRQDAMLGNEVRARLYERVRREPGIHRAELVEYTEVGEGATRHHLAQLVKHRLLVETHVDGFVRYFAAGEVPPEVARREAVLRAGSQRAVYELFAAEPHLSLREAADRLGVSAPSVHRAKKKLEAAGLLPAAATVRLAEA